MPRRRIPNTSLPCRPDRRRPRGNAIDAQHPPRRGRPGEAERIAERRTIALGLRKEGRSFREIASQLGVDVHTAHADVGAELAALRETAMAEVTDLRALELERLDGMNLGLWPAVEAGSPPAVSAAVKVSERRSKLMGLDAAVVTKNELTGSLGVYAERLAAERELFLTLTIEQMEALAAESQALLDRMTAMANGNARETQMLVGISPSPAVVDHVVPSEPTEQSTVDTVSDQGDAAGAEPPITMKT